MATGSPLIKVLIIYFGINIILYAGGVQTLNSDLVQINGTGDFTNDTVQYQVGSISGVTPNVNEQTSSGGFLSFIDVLRAVRGFVNFLITLFAGIFIVFLPFPPAIQLFVGVPLGFVFIIGLIYFTRSGQ